MDGDEGTCCFVLETELTVGASAWPSASVISNIFSYITTEENCSINELGRPMPMLNLSQKHKVKDVSTQSFNSKLYQKFLHL